VSAQCEKAEEEGRLRTESAQQIDDEANHQNQPEPSTTIIGSAIVKAAATEQKKEDQDEEY
jgi:hypothetical protein